MRLVFVSNYINHHQMPLSDELYRLSGGEYIFIQTEPMEEERVKMGWDLSASNKEYVKLWYKEKELCEKLIFEADCVIFGGTPRQELIIPRLEAGKFTIRYDERPYKEGRYKFISPRGLIQKYHDHIRYRKNDYWLLCAGAYVAGDYRLIGAYPKKKLKFGYFPKFVTYDNLNELKDNNNRTEILWAARFIDWKHPEVMVELARRIKDNNINAHISMIGSGELFESIRKSADNLSEIITFEGSKTPDEVREAMRKADIFISTSDRKEGWGAVVNEAMNSGCVTIAAKEIGAAPYLIEDGKNGFLYKACDSNAVFSIVKKIASEKALEQAIAERAYETIKSAWNAETAAKRLYEFIEDPKHRIKYEEGPLSRA